jgi:Tfp pilus assembly protein PilX
MLILNVVLGVAIVIAILSLLGWGIVTDRARVASLGRQTPKRARARAAAASTEAERRQYGRVPGLSS